MQVLKAPGAEMVRKAASAQEAWLQPLWVRGMRQALGLRQSAAGHQVLSVLSQPIGTLQNTWPLTRASPHGEALLQVQAS